MIGARRESAFAVVFAAVMASLTACAASTWYVSTSGNDSNSGKTSSAALKTIQKAVDKASANDTILVAKGTYSYIVIPGTKTGLTVKATGLQSETIIKGASQHRCVTIGDGSVTNIYVVGFTLTGASTYDSGNSGAGALGGTYNNCLITGNTSGSFTTGAGAYKCTLNGCTISNNQCSDWTGGIESCIASNCVITANKSTNVGAGGAAGCILIECKITDNTGGGGGGGARNCTLYRCLLENNTRTSNDDAGREINVGTAYDCVIKANKGNKALAAATCYNCTIVSSTGSPSIWRDTKLYNCIVSSTGNAFGINGDGNWGVDLYNCLLNNVSLGTYVTKSGCITADPKFVSTSNFNLQNTSPCIDKGNNSYVSTSKDYLGKQRIMNGKVDIGAYEYQTPTFSVKTISGLQRYPWNGLVDVQFRFTETTANTMGQVTLSAKDVAGNTNLPMRTIRKSNGAAVNTAGESLSPGTYKWVWDAAADLPKDFKRERVTVSVKVSNVTGTSGEFRMDLSGMGPWEMRTARASEAIGYSTAWATNALTGANAVVKVYPAKREKPKYIVIDLSGGTAATHYPIEYLDEIPGGSWSDEYKTSKLVLRHIPAGSFIMGGRATDYPGAVNTNLHMVTLTKDFYMGVFEVTQRQWELVMGNRPSAFSNETCYAARPVECVSYVDIRGGVKGIEWPMSFEVDDGSFLAIIRRRSLMSRLDLPTSAQWEYSCRAGTTAALNTGADLSNMTMCHEMDAHGRYRYNSGLEEFMQSHDKWSDFTNLLHGDDKGTSMVGTFQPNAWGLYDMHGNVYEWCLDRLRTVNEVLSESVDPVGSRTETNGRVLRSGSWNSPAATCRSSSIYDWKGQGQNQGGVISSIGFRLCLQGGEIPEATEGVQLVNAAGEGTANWTPTKAGTYYLTHETQTNGVNGAELLGAWLEVAGPELTFTPDGDLTPGVKIAINGAGEGWHVHYTLDGSAPTHSSASEYAGPITLNDSQTIRAIAFSDGGLASREFSATYSLMSIGSAVAKPRYPWNGKVDIDCEVKGDSNLEYLVSLSALDLDGSTNLPVRTVVGRAVPGEPQSPANEFVFGGHGATALPPGTYRFTWDADADIADDFDFANVAVKVSAEGSAIIAAKKVLPLEVAGYTGTEVLTNVPVLVRLSTAIAGFSYADFADANGGDVMFTDESGSVVYPHEIDEWHTNGESLVWVKLPTMAKGTKFKMAYGNSQLTTHNSQLSPHEVWRDYAGVWHMNEDSGTAFDSTAHGLDALPETGTNKTINISSEMVVYANGACGRARQNETSDVNAKLGCGNYLLTPSYDALALGSTFVVSGWFRADRVVNFPRMISRKLESSDAYGWEIHPRQNSCTNISVRGSAGSSLVCTVPDMKERWVNISAVYAGTVFSCYTNGVLSLTGESYPANDNGVGLAFGCNPPGNAYTWCGQYDEIRLQGGSLSADRIKADYDMIKNRNFLTYGPVESGRGAEE